MAVDTRYFIREGTRYSQGGGEMVGIMKVRDSFTQKEAKRVTLTPGSESTQTFAATFEVFHALNYGPGDVYLDIDSAAAVGGADDVLVKEGTSITLPVSGSAVHVIGASNSVVQLIGYRTPAS